MRVQLPSVIAVICRSGTGHSMSVQIVATSLELTLNGRYLEEPQNCLNSDFGIILHLPSILVLPQVPASAVSAVRTSLESM